MSVDEQFDELARRKLAEREIPFNEADWHAARELIAAERGRRAWGKWALGAALLLLIGGGYWMMGGLTRDEGGKGAAGTAQVSPGTAQATEAAFNADQPETNLGSSALVATEVKDDGNVLAEGQESALRSPVVAQQADQPGSLSNGSIATPALPQAKNRTSESAGHDAVGPEPANAESPAESRPVRRDPVIPDERSGMLGVLVAEASTGATRSADAGERGQAPTDIARSSHANEPHAGTSGTALDLAGTSRSANTVASPAATDDAPPFDTMGDDLPLSYLATILTLPDNPVEVILEPAMEFPPSIGRRASWEVTAVGGLFLTDTRYSGSGATDWADDVEPAPSAGFGLEWMRMGRNIGFGTGLHYARYVERFRSAAVDVETTTYDPYWYLMPVDTTVLLITDTMPGTPPTYSGTSVTTTVHVLTEGTDTITEVQRLREARDQLNRVSYLEIPLLADGHLVQGRWSLGLRGGPTIGLLTARRGALPDPAGEDYLAFANQPFRAVVFGYAARAYVRYRFNAGWSVGVEPAVRGQLFNTLNSGAMDRRSMAKGVVFSLTYRLR